MSPPYVDVERELTEAIPLSHRSFLHNLVPSYETAEIVVGHVLPGPDQAGRFRIGGHTPQLASVPTVGEGFASVDTGCGTLERGTLSCFLWPSRSWRSVAV